MTALRNAILVGDALDQMQRLPDASIDMVLTSPPYFRLRDYQVDGQLGLEGHVEQWVASLREVAAEAARVLVPTGSLWLNVADTYSTHPSQGAGRKSLLLGPERLALALIADGWALRNKIIWQKSNPVPTSVQDRFNCTWDAVYVLTRQPRYFFDLDAVRVPYSSPKRKPVTGPTKPVERENWQGPNSARGRWQSMTARDGATGHPLGKNPGDVWRIAGSNYRGGHRATFPVALPERAILASCPEARCTNCRLPWQRKTIRALGGTAVRGTLGPTCGCGAPSEPGLVLDPFFGAGTTAVAAERLHRDWLVSNSTRTLPSWLRGAFRTPAPDQPSRLRCEDLDHPPSSVSCGRAPLTDLSKTDRLVRTRTEEVAMSIQDTGSTGKAGVKTLAIRLEPETHAQLSLIAQLRGNTITGEIKAALDAHIAGIKNMPDLAARAGSVLEDIEREALARRTAIATLFGNEQPAPVVTTDASTAAAAPSAAAGTAAAAEPSARRGRKEGSSTSSGSAVKDS